MSTISNSLAPLISLSTSTEPRTPRTQHQEQVASQLDPLHSAGSRSQPADMLEQLNEAMRAWNTGMRFEMDDESQRLVVSIIDTQSGEVLRQIPNEETLRIARMIVQFQGNLVNTQA